MNPYHETEHGVLYHGCCLEIMPMLTDKSVSMVFTSPPYNMRLRIRNGEYTQREMGAHFSKKYTEFNDALPMQEYYDFHRKAIAEMLRIAGLALWNIQIVTGSKEAVFKLIGNYSKQITDIIIWDKGFGQPSMNNGVLNRGSELIIAFEDNNKNGRTFNKYAFERGAMQDIWREGRGGNGNIEGHGAVFPVNLAAKAILGFTGLNDLILDPFAGSGTTAIACIRYKRRYILVEKEEKYCEIAARRIDTELDQTDIFRDGM